MLQCTMERMLPMADMPKMPDFSEFTKMFANLKMPAAPNMEAYVAASRRNMETIAAANRVAMEGAQAVGKRHMEIMQQGMTDMTEAMRSLVLPENPQAKAAKQAEMLKRAYEHAVANMKELGEMIQHSNGEAIGLLNTRFTEALEEVKALAIKA